MLSWYPATLTVFSVVKQSLLHQSKKNMLLNCVAQSLLTSSVQEKRQKGIKGEVEIKISRQIVYCGSNDADLLFARWWRHTVYFNQIGVLLIQDHIQFSLVWLLADYPVVCHCFYDDFLIFINPGRWTGKNNTFSAGSYMWLRSCIYLSSLQNVI